MNLTGEKEKEKEKESSQLESQRGHDKFRGGACAHALAHIGAGALSTTLVSVLVLARASHALPAATPYI